MNSRLRYISCFLSILSLSSITLSAQNGPNRRALAEEVSPLAAAERAAEPKVISTSAELPAPKVVAPPQLQTYWSLERKAILANLMKLEPLSTRHQIDNPFSLQALDNPFALNVPRKAKAAERDYLKPWQEFFDTIFETQNRQYGTAPMWFILVLISLLSLLSLSLTQYRSETQQLVKSFVSQTTGTQYREASAQNMQLSSLVHQVLFGLGMGSLVFLMVPFFRPEVQFGGFGAWLLCVLGVSGLSMAKQLQYSALAAVFPFDQELNVYRLLTQNSHKIMGLAALPFVALMAYAPQVLTPVVAYLSISLMLVILGYRIFRGVVAGSDWILLHKFHFLLYLCSVEIAPLLIGMKYFNLF